MKPSGPGLLFAGNFLITLSISMLVIGLSIFLFLPDSGVEGYTFLSIRSFLPSFPFYWHIVLIVPYGPLYFCVFCCNFSILISTFVVLIILPLFIDESG